MTKLKLYQLLAELRTILRRHERGDEIAHLQISSMGTCYVNVGGICIFVGGIIECSEFLSIKGDEIVLVPSPRPDDDLHSHEREVTAKSDFVECETCRKKPGMAVLCDGCLRNRQLIGILKRKLEKRKKKKS